MIFCVKNLRVSTIFGQKNLRDTNFFSIFALGKQYAADCFGLVTDNTING